MKKRLLALVIAMLLLMGAATAFSADTANTTTEASDTPIVLSYVPSNGSCAYFKVGMDENSLKPYVVTKAEGKKLVELASLRIWLFSDGEFAIECQIPTQTSEPTKAPDPTEKASPLPEQTPEPTKAPNPTEKASPLPEQTLEPTKEPPKPTEKASPLPEQTLEPTKAPNPTEKASPLPEQTPETVEFDYQPANQKPCRWEQETCEDEGGNG